MDKIQVARSSLFAAIGLTALKFVVGLWTGSLGILSEAVHSSLDLIAAILTLIAVRVSDKPADQQHQFGHGKVENLSALAETALLAITCVWIIIEAVRRLSSGRLDIDVNVWSFVVIVVAIIVDISRSRALERAARQHKSQALEADALHFSSDVLSSGVVLLGLVCYLLNIHWADAVASIIVSVIVLVVGWRLGKRAVDELLDTAPSGASETVQAVLKAVDGVVEAHDIRVRSSGPDVIIDLNIHARPELSLREAHQVSEEVERRIADAIQNARVHVHVEPIGHDATTEGEGKKNG